MKRMTVLISLPLMLLCGCTSSRLPVCSAPVTVSPATPYGVTTNGERLTASVPANSIRKLTLARAFPLAEGRHPELALARARVEAAQGRIEQTGLLPNPEAVARMESAPLDGSTRGEAEYVAGVSQGLPLGGRLAAASRVERLDRERLVRELQARQKEVRARLQGAFATALYTEQVIDVQVTAVEVADHGVTIAKARLAAGDALPEEVARAEMEFVRSRVERERAQSLHRQALVALIAAIGDPAVRVESVEGSLEVALEVPALETLSAELSATPFMATAEADIAVQRARVNLAEAQRIPDVNLDLFYRRLEHSERDSFDVGVGIPIPLFDRNQGTLREMRAGVTAAEARARSQQNELERRLREAHATLVRSLTEARTLRDEILPRSQIVLKAAETRYAAGDGSLADILPVRRDWTAVQLAYLESLRDVMAAWADLSLYLREG